MAPDAPGRTAQAGLPASDPAGAEVHAAVLGVTNSACGRSWYLNPVDEAALQAMARATGLGELAARILAARGLEAEAAARHLAPSVRDFLPDPSALADMDKAAARLAAAVQAGETIAVFGDYDVDGATSSALLVRYLRAVGAEALLHIPDRQAEGYGLSCAALHELAARGAQVVVAVDCGVTAFEPAETARALGLDLIVFDHHTPGAFLPPAHALVNPKRAGEPAAFADLAACGVTFCGLVALNRCLRQNGWFREGREEPDLLRLLDIVALGTVCDVVPLVGLNRAFVAQGLKVMAGRGNAGLAALAAQAGLHDDPECYHLGFVLGPRVNAGGRVGRASDGAHLLATEDPAEAARLARALDEANRERQAIEAQVELEAMTQIEELGLDRHPMILSWGEGWHPGVVGIVASRLKDRYDRPACVVTIEGEDAKGSGRSVPGFDLGRAILAAREGGLLTEGGGHAMAAGFSLKVARLPELARFLETCVAERFDGLPPTLPLMLDCVLAAEGLTLDLASTIEKLGPFGAGNPEPLVAIQSAFLHHVAQVGERHVRVQFGTAAGGPRLSGIAFRAVDTPLGEALFRGHGAPVHLAGRVKRDRWRGRETAQLQIVDAALAW